MIYIAMIDKFTLYEYNIIIYTILNLFFVMNIFK